MDGAGRRADEAVESAGGGEARALALAYRFLNRRERTVAEVRARLAREPDISQQAAQAVIAELVGYGYLDDARYARVFAQDRRTLDSWGTERIARTLRERGVAAELVAQALSDAGADGQPGELELAVALLRARFPSGPSQPRDRERAFGVLMRKGYESEVSADAVRSWARGEG